MSALFLHTALLGLHSSDPSDDERICAVILRKPEKETMMERLLPPELNADLYELRRSLANPSTKGEVEAKIATILTSR